MPNIRPADLGRPGEAATILSSVTAELGGVPNIYATMARSPATLEGFLAFSGALSTGMLGAGLREQIALAVAGENECNYCASAHTLMAKGAGIGAAEAALNLAGRASDPKVSAILKFVRTVVQTRGRNPENASLLNELRNQGVSDGEIVEILAHVGLNLFTNYFNHVADTKIDFPFVTATAKQNFA